MRLAYTCLILLSCAETLPPTATTPSTPGPAQAANTSSSELAWPSPLTYPATKRTDISERFHDQTIADPYRWLENIESAEVQAWANAQNQLAESVLERLETREPIRTRMAELMRTEWFGVPMRRKKHSFWRYSDGRQEQPVIVVADSPDAAARWLSENGYTTARQLGATGTSGGGFLVGAAALQQPTLFGAVVPIAGVYDLLRFQLFGEGAGWAPDFPSAAEPAGFRALLALSPLHSVRANTNYPPMLVVTSDNDVRVAPLHSFKLAASLQSAQAARQPELLRVWSKTGHGRGTTLSQLVEQNTEVLSFFAHALQLPAAASNSAQ